VGGGCGNAASTVGATVSGGRNNIASGCSSSTIGGGNSNTASGIYSGILGGENNNATCNCSMIIGNNITSNRLNTTFVNNLSIMNIPTSSAGLPAGSVWNDGGTLKIV
jgi:hypothetical protein